MTKNMMVMRRQWFLVPIGVVTIGLLLLSKSPIFSSGLPGIAPSSLLNHQKWLAAFGLARHTFFTASVSSDRYVVAGQRYDVPLPINSFRNSDRDSRPYSTGNGNGSTDRNRSTLRSYITYATPEQLGEYYSTTLPEAGWEFSDRMGAVRIYRKNAARLAVSDSFYQGTRITQLNLAID